MGLTGRGNCENSALSTGLLLKRRTTGDTSSTTKHQQTDFGRRRFYKESETSIHSFRRWSWNRTMDMGNDRCRKIV
jgi:hypothetical protein